jgi:hypothetical protein
VGGTGEGCVTDIDHGGPLARQQEDERVVGAAALRGHIALGAREQEPRHVAGSGATHPANQWNRVTTAVTSSWVFRARRRVEVVTLEGSGRHHWEREEEAAARAARGWGSGMRAGHEGVRPREGSNSQAGGGTSTAAARERDLAFTRASNREAIEEPDAMERDEGEGD